MSNPRITTTQVNPSQTLTPSTPAGEGQPAARRQAPLSLFQQSTFGQAAGTSQAGGLALGAVGQDGGDAQKFFAGLSDDEQQGLLGHSRRLASAIWTAVGATPPYPQEGAAAATTSSGAATGAGLVTQSAAPAGRSLAAASIQTPAVYGSNTQLTGAVNNTLTALQSSGNGSTFDTNVAQTAYLGILGLDNDLKSYAGTVHSQLANANQARVQYRTISDTVANWPAGQDTVQFTWTELDSNGLPSQKSGALTKEQAQAKLETLQQTISQIGSQTQTQQLVLQDLTNKYQQGIETLTNVLKFQFDTTKAIINNLKV